jgi:hypothetical protein
MKFDPVSKKMVISTDDGKESSVSLGESGISAQSSDGGTLKLGILAANATPSWVPLYPGSTPQGTMSTNNAEGTSNTFTFKTADPSSKVLTFYSDQLKTAGFTITLSAATGSGGLLQAQDQDKKRMVMITTSADGASITAIEKK